MRPLYLIDAYNFLHAVVLKGRERANWWSSENQARVVSAVTALAAGPESFEAWVVFDRRGAASDAAVSGGAPASSAPGIEIHSAPDADDYIVARCAELAGQRELWVVSADRSLGDRARRHGARRLSPWAFAGAEPGGSAAGRQENPDGDIDVEETTDEERFVRLEVKCAYLEKLALDLNEVVIAQGQLIDQLTGRLDGVERQLRAAPEEEDLPHEKPPHY